MSDSGPGATAPNPSRHGDKSRLKAAAAEVLMRGLRQHASAFDPSRRAWTAAASRDLMERFVGQPDISGASFDEKLGRQLAGASDETILLFAEIFYLNLLPLSDYRPETKLGLVNQVLQRMSHPVTIPRPLVDALTGGNFNGGVAFKSRRYWQLAFFVEFAHGFLTDPPGDDVWNDPIAFRDRVASVTTINAPSQKYSLLYLAFPDFFLPIVSSTHRRMIVTAFSDLLDPPSGDEDRDLYTILTHLNTDARDPDDVFYTEPWLSRWNPNADTASRRAWLVRGSSVEGHDLIPLWLRDGFASLRAAKLRAVEPGISREELKEIVNDDYSQTSYAAKAAKVDEFHAFLSRMQVDDVVATTSQGLLYVGVVSGAAEYEPSTDGLSNLRRDVEWSPEGIDYADLPGEVKARLQVQYDVVEMTQQVEILESLLGPSVEDPDTQVLPPPPELALPDATDGLAQTLHVDVAWLQECIDLLRDRPQLIFYGPPGTGKTYIAQHLARHIAGDNVRLVQFHPAYSYEDFFEGYRPVETGGFTLKPGPLRKIVDAARENPSSPYVLIIDEINRGNLAKVFGELYFLLEYRDQNVDLLYATDDDIGFTLPRNVFLLGTMNTADRSIALVDAAMRRRFAFLPLHPSEPPTRDVLRRWLIAAGLDVGVADLLEELNSRIEDPDFKIGPSYVMRPAVHTAGGLERAWRTAILPLLEEHHFGEGIDVPARYGLAAISARVAERKAAADGTPGADASPA
jgi:5-methylcytosine-specific restriction enzyme B